MIDEYDLMQKRFRTNDIIPKDKLVKEKIKTFEIALQKSYNREKVTDLNNNNTFLSLIVGINTQPKTEKKSFSTLVRNGCSLGDVLYWEKVDSHWIITDYSETEGMMEIEKPDGTTYTDGIFQGYIEEALYNIKWQDKNSGAIYSQWVCSTGPLQTALSEGVKNNIMYDNPNFSITLKIPKNTEGIDILKRYKEIIIEGIRWQIEAYDDITYRGMIILHLGERIINKEMDSDELIKPLTQNDFIIECGLNDITEVELNYDIDINNLKITKIDTQKNIDYEVQVRNCNYNNGVITFDKLGTAIVVIKNNGFIYKAYTISVIEEKTEIDDNYTLNGNDIVKTLTTHEYEIKYYIEGNEETISYPINWNVNSNLVNVVSINDNKIKIKIGSMVGSFDIAAEVNGNILNKTITIRPLFG